MRTLLISLGALFLLGAGASAQTSTDARTLQAILDEIHKLRQDLQATTATVQRAQILLYRVRLQMDVVERVSQRLEQARSQSISVKNEQSHFLDAKKRMEAVAEQTSEAAKRKELEDEAASIQKRLDELKDSIS
jgi:hypothetical protein